MGRSLLLVVVFFGCVRDPNLLQGAPCPCVEGFVCCPTTLTCLRATACPQPDASSDLDAGRDATADMSHPAHRDAGGQDARPLDAAPIDVPTDLRAVDMAPEAAVDRGVDAAAPLWIDETLALGVDRADLNTFGNAVVLDDVDGDGHPDLYFGLPAAVPADAGGLYSGAPGFRFTERAAALGFVDLLRHDSVIPGDFDGDGVLDAVLLYRFGVAAEAGGNLAFLRGRPEGGVLPPVPIEMMDIDPRNPQMFSLAPVDVDGDGDLDLLGCRRLPARQTGQILVFVRNDAGRLHEVEPPIEADPRAAETGCLGAALGDFDADGDPDLAVCRNALRVYRNDAGTWRDVTRQVGLDAVHDDAGLLAHRCVQPNWVDLDGDGRLDLTWTGLANEPSTRTHIMRFDGQRFEPAPVQLTLPREDAGCSGAEDHLPIGNGQISWFDADFDGDQDAVVFAPFPRPRCVRPPYLVRNLGGLRFETVPIELAPALNLRMVTGATGSASGDLDLDGDLDVVANAWGGGRRIVLRNQAVESETAGHFVVVLPITDADGDATDADQSDDRLAPFVTVLLDLDGPADAPDFTPGPGALQVRGDTRGFHSQQPHSIAFGIGRRDPPVWVRVIFPDGSVVTQQIDRLGHPVEVRDCAGNCSR